MSINPSPIRARLILLMQEISNKKGGHIKGTDVRDALNIESAQKLSQLIYDASKARQLGVKRIGKTKHYKPTEDGLAMANSVQPVSLEKFIEWATTGTGYVGSKPKKQKTNRQEEKAKHVQAQTEADPLANNAIQAIADVIDQNHKLKEVLRGIKKQINDMLGE